MKKYKPIIRLHILIYCSTVFFELFLAALGGYMLFMVGMNVSFLRVLDFAQAKELTEGLGQCQIPKITCMRSVSANQNMDQIAKLFTSGYTERLDMTEVELLPPEILMSLPKGQAILVTEGNPPFKIRIPLLDKDASIEKESYFNRLLSQYEDNATTNAVPSEYVRRYDQGKEEYERNA